MSTAQDIAITHKTKIFFPNLDGLRFFSFLIVFLSHIFSTDNEGIKNTGWYKFFKGRLFSDGDLGVSFFFVLSGFLITYLLIKEKQLTGTVSIFSFYIRRALRIWPLYYFCVLFGFFLFPLLKTYFGQQPNETADPVLCSLFLNNFNQVFNGPPDSSVLTVLWSVAIEEQFYLLWPILFFLVKSKNYIHIFISVILISTIYRFVYYSGDIDIYTLGVISDMAIGGLGAYLVISNKVFLGRMENSSRFLNLIPYLAALVFIFFKYELFDSFVLICLKRLIIAFFFIWIILEQNFARKSLFKIANLRRISVLGKYTYGLYCLHGIACLVILIILSKLGWDKHSWQLWLIELPASLLLSIAMSYFSYHYFEKKFLRLKDRFAFIVKE